jgi:hypothetical protein
MTEPAAGFSLVILTRGGGVARDSLRFQFLCLLVAEHHSVVTR